ITAWIGTLTSPAVILRVQRPGPDFTTQVQPIFTFNCSAVSCHGNQAGLTLNGAARSYAELVNVPAETPGTTLLRVAPGDPNHSFLYIKLAGCPGPECRGSRMPFNEPPLPAAQ